MSCSMQSLFYIAICEDVHEQAWTAAGVCRSCTPQLFKSIASSHFELHMSIEWALFLTLRLSTWRSDAHHCASFNRETERQVGT
jgi:hypothetical protein